MMSADDVFRTKKKRIVKKRRNLAICTTYCQFDIVREVAKSLGMREVVESGSWNVFWTDMSISIERAKNMKGYQRINHFPGMSEICRKDLLARNLLRMKKLFPEEYSFFPKTWILPADYGALSSSSVAKKSKVYILKPFVSSQGRGIFLSIGLKNIPYFERMICQRYLMKPFLIDGFKFDLRVYTLVTSCDPLRVFVYNEGLVRFATTKYSRPSSYNINNVYMHLTNYAVNKFSRTYIVDDEKGSKRKISTLNIWLHNHGINVTELWEKVDDVIIKTLLSAYGTLRHNYWACFSSRNIHQACFELLGFDIILDQKLQPFLLEVNHSPSFGTKSIIDKEVKTSLIRDTFRILNINKPEMNKIIKEDKQRSRGRLIQGMNSKLDKEIEIAKRLQRLQHQERWEKDHIGNFRMIYPPENSSKYKDFIKEDTSLLQTTIEKPFNGDFQQRGLQTEDKGRLEAAKVKTPTKIDTMKPPKEALNISRDVDQRNSVPKMKPKSADATLVKRSKLEETESDLKRSLKPSLDYYIRNSFEPQAMETDLERRTRLITLKRRETMIKKAELVSKIYFSFKRQNLLSHSDKMKYGHLKES